MGSLEVIAVPQFSQADSDWLEKLRRKHAHTLGPPRFTLVFPGSRLDQKSFVAEVRQACFGTPAIVFCMRASMIVSDPQVNSFHLFLVPDEGFGALVRLHEALHRNALKPCLPPDLSYIPHLTIGSMEKREEAEQLMRQINDQDFAVIGTIKTLEIHYRQADLVRCIETIELLKQGWRHRLHLA